MYVKPGDELYTIADLSQIWITADIYEYELPFVKVGQTATVTRSRTTRRALAGAHRVYLPDARSTDPHRQSPFRACQPRRAAQAGMYANVELKIPLGMRLVVSTDAIRTLGSGS